MKALKIALAISAIVTGTQVLANNPGNPASFVGNASIQLNSYIEIFETTSMLFPATLASTSSNTVVHSDDTGGLDAIFDLTGHGNETYVFTVQTDPDSSCSANDQVELDGLELGSDGNTTYTQLETSTGAAFSSGTSQETVKGKITIYPGAPIGSYNCTYSVVANY